MDQKRRANNPLCAERMKELMEMKGIGTRDLARRCYCDPGTISKITNGIIDTSDSVADAVTKVFSDVTFEWIKGQPDAVKRPAAKRGIAIKKAEDRARPVLRFLGSFGYEIKRNDPWDLSKYGIDGLFYPIRDKMISQEKLTGIVDDVISLVSTYMDGVLRDAHTQSEIHEWLTDYVKVHPLAEEVEPTPQPELGVWMKATRENAGMSIQTLAKKINVPRKTIEAWENGERRPISTRHEEKGPFDNQFDRWCKALGVNTEKISK